MTCNTESISIQNMQQHISTSNANLYPHNNKRMNTFTSLVNQYKLDDEQE